MQTDEIKKIEQSGADVLYLINCALHKKTPDVKRLASMNLHMTYRMSVKHMVAAMTYYVVEPLVSDIMNACNAADDKDSIQKVFDSWRDVRDKAIRKIMLLDAARTRLFKYMDDEGIWYMPLKGVVLKDMYPTIGMRQMSDNDILFDSTYRSKVRDYFVSEGFKVENYGKGNHDVYKKKPVYNYEMHTRLFDESHDRVWAKYYDNVRERLIKDEGNKQGYHFTYEDFYVYFINHAYKHNNKSGGTGLRSYIDCYVYLKDRELDWDYIEGELKLLGIYEFENIFRKVSLKLFAEEATFEELSDDEYSLLSESIYGGVYGTFENGVRNRLASMADDKGGVTGKIKLRYYMRRLVPDNDWLKVFHPFVYRHKIILPFFLIYRVIRGFILHGGKLLKEIALVWKA